MSSPALNEKTLQRLRGEGRAFSETSAMTLNGTIHKSGLLILIAMLGGALGWGLDSFGVLAVFFVASLVLSILIILKPSRAASLSQAYAFSEGVLLGSISSVYARSSPGIVTNALLLTISCLVIMLALYRFKVIQVTDKVRSIIMGATMAVAVTYLISIVMSFFGSSIPMIHQSSPIGIAFSGLIVCVAAFNLLLDFDMIERAQAQGAPKYMEWYGGFALLVTLVWLYLEILKLLSKLNRR